MKVLWNVSLERDRELSFAAGLVERLRCYGLNVGKAFLGVMIADTTPGRVVVASDAPRRRSSSPTPAPNTLGDGDRNG